MSDKAISCGLVILEKLSVMRKNATSFPHNCVYATVGLHKGNVTLGNIGCERRKLDFTIIGDSVNTCARLQSYASHTKHSVVFSEKMLTDSNLEQVLHVGCVELKGKLDPVSVYTIKGHNNCAPMENELREMNNVVLSFSQGINRNHN